MKNNVDQIEWLDKDTKQLVDLLGDTMQAEARKTKEEFKLLLGAAKSGESAGRQHRMIPGPRINELREGDFLTRVPFGIGPDLNCITVQIPSTNYIWGVPLNPEIILNVPPFDTREVVGYSAANRPGGTIELLSQTFDEDTTAETFGGFRLREMSACLFIASMTVPPVAGLNATDISIRLHVSGTSLIWPGFTQQRGWGLSQLTAKLQVVFPSRRTGFPDEELLTQHIIPSPGVANLVRTDVDIELGAGRSYSIIPGERMGIGVCFSLLVAVTEDSNLTALANYSSLRSAPSRRGGITLPAACIRFCRVLD